MASMRSRSPLASEPAGLARLDRMVVLGAYDQVADAGFGSVGDAHRRARIDHAEVDEVVADAAG